MRFQSGVHERRLRNHGNGPLLRRGMQPCRRRMWPDGLRFRREMRFRRHRDGLRVRRLLYRCQPRQSLLRWGRAMLVRAHPALPEPPPLSRCFQLPFELWVERREWRRALRTWLLVQWFGMPARGLGRGHPVPAPRPMPFERLLVRGQVRGRRLRLRRRWLSSQRRTLRRPGLRRLGQAGFPGTDGVLHHAAAVGGIRLRLQ